MKKILLVLLLSAFLLPGCGAKDSGSSLPSGNMSNSVQTEELNRADEQQTAKPNQSEQPEEPEQAEKADLSGIYTDKQGTSDVYSELTLALQADGTYAAEISVYRTTELEGTAAWEGDALRFTSEDASLLADITVTGGKAEVTVITDALGLHAGDVYSFPDGAPDESEEGQAGEDASALENLIGEYDYALESETGRLVIQKTSDGYDISDYESESSYRFLADSSNIEAIENGRIYIKYPEQVFSDDTAVFHYYVLEYRTDEITVYSGKSSFEEAQFLYQASKKS